MKCFPEFPLPSFCWGNRFLKKCGLGGMSNFALSRKGGVIVKDLRESFT